MKITNNMSDFSIPHRRGLNADVVMYDAFLNPHQMIQGGEESPKMRNMPYLRCVRCLILVKIAFIIARKEIM